MFLNIHNLVRIELLNEPKGVRELLRFRMGGFETNSLDEDPDIRIRFTRHIELENKVRFIDNETAYGDGSLYIMRGGKKLAIPLKTSEKPRYDVICEAGFSPIKVHHLMNSFLDQHVLLDKGATFVHAAAVCFNNKGFLFPGWGDAGKTGMALALLKEGAEYMTDDLPIITQDGTILANPVPLNVARYLSVPLLKKTQFRRDSHYRAAMAKKTTLSILGAILPKMPLQFIRIIGDGASLRARQIELIAHVPFSALSPQGKIRKSVSLDAVFCLTSTGSREIEIEEINDKLTADRVAYSYLYLSSEVNRGLYEFLRIASPELGDILIQHKETKAKEIINKAFKAKPLYYVGVPRHFDLDQAFNKLVKYL
ncbi:hypothetical protein ACFLW4_04000 [Chloroflexota bacterium]